MEINEFFGKKISELRKEKGFSQEKLALEANIDRTYISDIEHILRGYERFDKKLENKVNENWSTLKLYHKLVSFIELSDVDFKDMILSKLTQR